MFERYTEKARRAIFYARYEASHYGSSTIDTNHLLLGLVREATGILRWAPALRADDVRKHMDANLPHLEPLPPSIGLPLSSDGKQALDFARDEADRMGHRYIGTEHLFLSILGVEDSFAARLLRNGGADAPSMRVELAEPVRTISNSPPTRLLRWNATS